MSNDDFDFGEGRTRLRRAFAEGSKAMALRHDASRNSGPVGYCAPCKAAQHDGCTGLAPEGEQDRSGRCRCPVCKDKLFVNCFRHGHALAEPGRNREGARTACCIECRKIGRVTQEILEYSRSN